MKEVNELVDIAMYCNTVMVRHGQKIDQCTATYIPEDDNIEFKIVYAVPGERFKSTYMKVIPGHQFIVTDFEVLVNRDVIEEIALEINKRLSPIAYCNTI